MSKISITFDTEPDLHSGKYLSITQGIPRILLILNKYQIKATFFTTCDCIEKYPQIFQELKKQGHEISSHGYRHLRFDGLSYNEKKEQIEKSIECFNKYFGEAPKSFRAPQLSISNSTLDLLEKYGFKYDSSYAPLDFLLLLYYPKKFRLWLKQFFSPRQKYKIRKNLYEIPTSAFFIPFVSILFRVFHRKAIQFYLNILKLFHNEISFYFHSWDFIDIPQSRIARTWPKEKIIKNLDYFIKKNKNDFCRMQDLIK